MVRKKADIGSTFALALGGAAAVGLTFVAIARAASAQPPPPSPPPIPPPIPPPPPDGEIVFGRQRGVNLKDPVLNWTDSQQTNPNPSFIPGMIAATQLMGCNTWRLLTSWNAWNNNKSAFISHLVSTVSAASNAGIKLWIAFFQFMRNGFPDYVKNVGLGEEAWWRGLYSNSLPGVSDVWAQYFSFMQAVIDVTKTFTNVMGYELINEPHIYQTIDYTGLGNMQTYLGGRVRSLTSKAVIFTRGLKHGSYTLDFSKFYLQAPRNVSGEVWYIPHLYADPRRSGYSTQLASFVSHENKWKATAGYTNIKYVGIGEWAIQDNDFSQPDLPTLTPSQIQAIYDTQITTFRDRGLMSAYWQQGGFFQAMGNVLVNTNPPQMETQHPWDVCALNVPGQNYCLTQWGNYLKSSLGRIQPG